MTNAFLHGYLAGYMHKQGQVAAADHFVNPQDQLETDQLVSGSLVQPAEEEAKKAIKDYREVGLPGTKSLVNAATTAIPKVENKLIDLGKKTSAYLSPSMQALKAAVQNTKSYKGIAGTLENNTAAKALPAAGGAGASQLKGPAKK